MPALRRRGAEHAGIEPEVKAEKPARTHWDMLLERRSEKELEDILKERLELLRGGEIGPAHLHRAIDASKRQGAPEPARGSTTALVVDDLAPDHGSPRSGSGASSVPGPRAPPGAVATPGRSRCQAPGDHAVSSRRGRAGGSAAGSAAMPERVGDEARA